MFEKILQAIKDHDRIIIHRHNNPDGDAMGSQIGLKHIILHNFPGKEVLVVGFDATDDAIAAINEGRMAATIAQQPEMIGKVAVETAVKLIAGETIEANIPVEVALVTAE